MTHPDIIADVARFSGELVSHGCGAGVIFNAAARAPESAYVQSLAASAELLAATRESYARAAGYIAAAQRGDARSDSERLLLGAVIDWHAGREGSAIAALRGIVEIAPHDLVAAKICQILQLANGDLAGMRAAAATVVVANPDCGFAHGLYAFALEQSEEFALAERHAHRALALNGAHNPWAQHAMTHVLAARGQYRDGLAFLRAHAPTWDRCSSFMITHNWWHAALFAIELGDEAAALAMFDQHVWGVRKSHPQDQVNAISLLARLELAGVDVGARWTDVGDHAARRAADRVQGFMDLHYVYALARADRDADVAAMLRDIAARPEALLPIAAHGMVAHARGDFAGAARLLGAARSGLVRAGGSNVQRELFGILLNDSMLRSRRTRRAHV